jgi:hypothetical protein
MRRVLATVVTLVMLAATSLGQAQERPSCDARVRAIAATLDADARRTRTWYWAWMAAGTALIVGQGTWAAFATKGNQRNELIVGASASVFIPSALLFHPPPVLGDARVLDARLATLALDDPCLVLPGAVQRLVRDGTDQAFYTGFFSHAFVIGGNIALGLLLGVVLHDWPGGAKQTLGGIAISELQILTLPTGTLKMQGLGFVGTF